MKRRREGKMEKEKQMGREKTRRLVRQTDRKPDREIKKRS